MTSHSLSYLIPCLLSMSGILKTLFLDCTCFKVWLHLLPSTVFLFLPSQLYKLVSLRFLRISLWLSSKGLFFFFPILIFPPLSVISSIHPRAVDLYSNASSLATSFLFLPPLLALLVSQDSVLGSLLLILSSLIIVELIYFHSCNFYLCTDLI